MSEARRANLKTMARSDLEVLLITPDRLPDWVAPDAPLHPAFSFLSAVHRSDYLRAYFMHHHGGGYCDVKKISASWLPAFEALAASDVFGIGYKEVSRKGVAHIHRHHVNGTYFFGPDPTGKWANWVRYYALRSQWRRLIGNGAYIFKPETAFTKDWLATIERRLDFARPYLAQNPARHPRANRDIAETGSGDYPLPWSFICADVFHPLVYKNRTRILNSLPPPSFKDYQ